MRFTLVPKNTSCITQDNSTVKPSLREVKVLLLVSKQRKDLSFKHPENWDKTDSLEGLDLNKFSHCLMLDDFKIDSDQFENTHFFYGSIQTPDSFRTRHNPNVTVFWIKGLKEVEQVLINSVKHLVQNEDTPAKPLTGKHVLVDTEFDQPKEHEPEEALKQGL